MNEKDLPLVVFCTTQGNPWIQLYAFLLISGYKFPLYLPFAYETSFTLHTKSKTNFFSPTKPPPSPSFPVAMNRKLEARSATGNGSPSRSVVRNVSRSLASGKRSPPAVEKLDRKMPYSRSGKEERTNASTAQAADETPAKPEQEAVVSNNTSSGLEKKGTVEVIEWPRIYVSLSRKEKEEDFLAMKGTKLPHRPKKRAKNVDKTLQYCFPGMWLSDLTKNRYEVREKKSVKKQKRRGLKGMGSMDSDSE